MATKPVITPKAAPEKRTTTFKIPMDEIIYTDKAGRTFTGEQALDLVPDVLKALGYAASRVATLARDRDRKASGKAASRLYVNGNLPAEASDLAAQFRATMAALVPTMAPKAPVSPKAAPVPALDLSDPLETAVSQELASEPPKAAPKARKPKAAPQDTKAATAQALAAPATVIPAGVTKASARKAASEAATARAVGALLVKEGKAATVEEGAAAFLAPTPVEAPKAAPPVVRSLSGLSQDHMAALLAKQAARKAAKLAKV